MTKTFALDKDAITNVSPRIYKLNDPVGVEPSYANIELISEKTAEYWISGAKDIKRDYPDRVLIGSVMAGYNK